MLPRACTRPGTLMVKSFLNARQLPRLLLIAVVFQAFGCEAHHKSATVDVRLAALHKIEEASLDITSNKAKSSIVSTAHDLLFGIAHEDSSTNALGDHDLRALFDAASLAAFYTTNDRYVVYMKAFLQELQQRGLASAKQYQSTYEALVKNRMLTAATRFAQEHPLPELERL